MPKSGNCFRKQAPEPSRRVALAWRRNFPRPQAIEALVQAMATVDNPSYHLLA